MSTVTLKKPSLGNVKVSRHAALRYLTRKVGYSQEELSISLVEDAREELQGYLAEAHKIGVKDGAELYYSFTYDMEFRVVTDSDGSKHVVTIVTRMK